MQFDVEEWSNKETWALMSLLAEDADSYYAVLEAAENALSTAYDSDGFISVSTADAAGNVFDTRNNVINTACFIAAQYVRQIAGEILNDSSDGPGIQLDRYYDYINAIDNFGAIDFDSVAEFFVLEALSESEMA